MDVKDIKKLLDAIASADVNEFSYETGDFKIAVQRGAEQVVVQQAAPAPQAAAPAPSPAAAAPAPAPGAHAPAPAAGGAQPAEAPAGATGGDAGGDDGTVEVTAPIVGTFYEAPAPDADPYVQVGDKVKAGTVLCIIEAMKLMNEIEAETSGTIREILVRNEDPVEYGQTLFRIEPD